MQEIKNIFTVNFTITKKKFHKDGQKNADDGRHFTTLLCTVYTFTDVPSLSALDASQSRDILFHKFQLWMYHIVATYTYSPFPVLSLFDVFTKF